MTIVAASFIKKNPLATRVRWLVAILVVTMQTTVVLSTPSIQDHTPTLAAEPARDRELFLSNWFKSTICINNETQVVFFVLALIQVWFQNAQYGSCPATTTTTTPVPTSSPTASCVIDTWDYTVNDTLPCGQVVYFDLPNAENIGLSIPLKLFELTALTYLDIDRNDLTGTIPTEFGQLTSLTYLDLALNALTGTIPTEFGQLTSLTSLNLGGNDLTGTIPTEFGQLTNLTSLNLYNHDLNGTIPTELGRLTSLLSLSLYNIDLTGTIPTELGRLTSLTYLDLAFNALTGTIPTELGQGLTSLETGYFEENQLNGTNPFCTFQNRTFKKLRADCNKVFCTCCKSSIPLNCPSTPAP